MITDHAQYLPFPPTLLEWEGKEVKLCPPTSFVRSAVPSVQRGPNPAQSVKLTYPIRISTMNTASISKAARSGSGREAAMMAS